MKKKHSQERIADAVETIADLLEAQVDAQQAQPVETPQETYNRLSVFILALRNGRDANGLIDADRDALIEALETSRDEVKKKL